MEYLITSIIGPFIHSLHIAGLCAPDAPLQTRATEKQGALLHASGKGLCLVGSQELS